MSRARQLPVDQEAREAAVRERARNVLIDAGAGTGKTTVLVDRVVELVAPLSDGSALSLDRLAVVTFTRRAAGELRLRLREAFLQAGAAETTSAQRRERLRDALARLDTAYIGTIHGFADRLLRLRPIEARLSPSYEIVEDDEELVSETWERLLHAVAQGTLESDLAGTLAEPLAEEARRALTDALRAGIQAETWEGEFFSKHGLSSLVAELVRHRDVQPRAVPEPHLDAEALRGAIHEFVKLARQLPGESRFARWARHTAERFDRLRNETDPVLLFAEVAQTIWERRRSKNRPKKAQDCDGDDSVWCFWKILHEGAPHRETRGTPLGDDLVGPLHHWLGLRLLRAAPAIVELYEQVKAHRKVVDQIDLLLRLRNVLQRDRETRGFYQGLFDHVLVDEFQDTDPLQAEIVLYLCERTPVAARWKDIEVADGKLTLVGDPKQSIYRFRRADVAMYEAIRSHVGPRALAVELRANFRTAPALVRILNDRLRGLLGEDPEGRVFDVDHGRVFHRDLAEGRTDDPGEVVHVIPFEPEEGASLDAEGWRRLEARATARYLRWLVEQSGLQIFDPGSRSRRSVRFGDVCVLTLATTNVSVLLHELDEHGLPYAAAGGRLFLEDPLHTQFLLGLRALSDRDDGAAQAALLRPPFFAIDLADLVRWRSDPEGDHEAIARVRLVRERIRELRRRRFGRPPGATARALLDQTGFARRMALLPGGAQRLERLRELTHVVDRLAVSEGLDFDGVTHRLRSWIDRPVPLDPPASPDADAVRVLTVHQAKGLEFPVVLWWDGQASLQGPVTKPPWRIDRDGSSWSLALFGLECAQPAETDLGTRERRYLDEERRRLVYVACTRARDLLVLPSPKGSRPRGNPVCRELEPPEGTPGVRWLEPYLRGRGAPWAGAFEPSEDQEAGGADDLERDLETSWVAALSSAGEPRFRPVAVTQRAASPPPVDEELESSGKHEEGRFGPRFGTAVHRAIGYVLGGAESSSERAVQRAAKAVGLDEHLDEATLDVRRSVDAIRKEGWSGAEGTNFRLEYPVSGPGADGVLLLGSIDLVAIERGRVSIVDFKTDTPPPAGALLPPHYRDQARTYAQLLTEAGLTGDQGVRLGLLYTADGTLRWFDENYHPEGHPARQNA